MAESFSIDLNNKTFLIQQEKKPVIPEIQKYANEERYFTQLRDSFSAGYQFPQYCIDHNIKKPLFVGVDESQKTFLWEIYTQFNFDKTTNTKIDPRFVFFKGESQEVFFAPAMSLVAAVKIKNISEINPDEYDKIIVLGIPKNGIKNNKFIFLPQIREYFFRQMYFVTPLLNYVKKYPSVKLILINNPLLTKDVNNNENEKNILNNRVLMSGLHRRMTDALSKGETFPTPYDFLGYTFEETYKLTSTEKIVTAMDGSTLLTDDEFLHIRNGIRMTANQPENYKNTIYFIGDCMYYGAGVPWDKTVASHLQNFFNKDNLAYRVENLSQYNMRRFQDTYYTLNKIQPKNNDIIFFRIDSRTTIGGGLPFFDVTNIFKRPHNYGEVFPDPYHINELGHKALAEKIFEYLTENNFFQDVEFNYLPPPPVPHRYGIPKENFSNSTNFLQNPQLEEYKNKLREKRISIGCIVMNCNPFTHGHEYLVEYASKKVHKLYIFVVEEDKSQFKFEDRFKLVQEGTKPFPNVEVIPSGQFIISQQTFSGYFNKESLQDVQVDSSEDVEIFAREIAPTLGITVRFVGQEPEDTVTNQYNENMKRILPQHNIDVCEIPRREIDGEVISAKKVRKALESKDFDKIKKLVPKTTYDFLVENYSETK